MPTTMESRGSLGISVPSLGNRRTESVEPFSNSFRMASRSAFATSASSNETLRSPTIFRSVGLNPNR